MDSFTLNESTSQCNLHGASASADAVVGGDATATATAIRYPLYRKRMPSERKAGMLQINTI